MVRKSCELREAEGRPKVKLRGHRQNIGAHPASGREFARRLYRREAGHGDTAPTPSAGAAPHGPAERGSGEPRESAPRARSRSRVSSRRSVSCRGIELERRRRKRNRPPGPRARFFPSRTVHTRGNGGKSGSLSRSRE